MTETEAAANDKWVIDRLFGEDPVPGAPEPELVDRDSVDAEQISPDPVGADQSSDDALDTAAENDDGNVNAGAKRTAVWLGAAVFAASVLIVGAFTLCSRPSRPVDQTAALPAWHPAAVSAAPRTSAAPAPPDQAIPFTAAAPGCKSGSTSAQSLSASTGDAPWVCVRGTPDEQADGQVLHVDFRCDAVRTASVCSYLVTSVSVTPGSVPATAGSHDGWLAHRVVSRLQYNFYNGNELADILTQDTGNVHGPASAGLRRPVLASRVVVIVLQTARPPVSPLPGTNTAAGPPQPGLVDPEPDTSDATVPTLPSTATDPVDAAFAVSGMQFFGHQPN
ncbi:hypothetical protein [Mycobacterium sp.]|uniref:hypothetical protein n=1 Tax=Mycobacterium sp. TaxID=1785 RepID=UPI003D118F72